MPAKISVLLVEDHHLVRRGFRRMLEDEPDIEVVGEASDGAEAVEKAAELHPAVVVMDYALPSMNGAVAARHILKSAPETAVLMLSMHSEPNYVRSCLEAGARGYLLKNGLDLEVVDAVRKAPAGARVRHPLPGRRQQGDSPATAFTTRELEGLQLIVHSKSNREIAIVL